MWNPSTDQFLRARYTRPTGAQAHQQARHTGDLGSIRSDVPLFGVVSRLAHQKGIDLILATLDALVSFPAQLVVLGTGDPTIERSLRNAGGAIPDVWHFHTGLDESLAHQIEAGADIFLMPSRFEPCGLNQMYSQIYGTVPIARRTGGLVDTMRPVSAARGTGFLFDDPTPDALLDAMRNAVATLPHRHTWQSIQRNGMGQVFSWQRSAAQYLRLYQGLIAHEATPA